jgi:hypothetical protein
VNTALPLLALFLLLIDRSIPARQVEQPKEPVFQPVAWDTLKFDEVPLSKWRAFGAYSRPVVNHVEVHNTFSECAALDVLPF